MKKNAPYIAALGLALLATFAPGSMTSALAQGGGDCLSARQAQEAKSSGEILDLPQIYAQNGFQPNDVLGARVCNQGGELYYVLSVYQGANAETVWINARTGTP